MEMDSLEPIYDFRRELPNKKGPHHFPVYGKQTKGGTEKRAVVLKTDFEYGSPVTPRDSLRLAEKICRATQTNALEIISNAENAAVIIRPFDCQ